MAGTEFPHGQDDDRFVIQELDGEVLVFDRHSGAAHCLAPEAGKVWRASTNGLSAEQLAEATDLDDATVQRALRELDGKDLLDERQRTGMSRRHLIGRLAVVAAGAPLVSSVLASSAHAQTVSCNLGVAGNTGPRCDGSRPPCCPGSTCCNTPSTGSTCCSTVCCNVTGSSDDQCCPTLSPFCTTVSSNRQCRATP
jgi:hypothetical protein